MRCLTVWLGMMLGLAGSLQAGTTYTLTGCFNAALKQSEVMADQAEQIIQAEERFRQAWGSMLPQAGIYGTYLRQDAGGSAPAEQTLIKLNAAVPLFRGFREFAALRQARETIAFQKESQQWAELQLYQDVAQSFYTVLALEKDQAHLNEQIALYQQRIEDLNAWISIGRSRPSEVLSVQSAKASLKAQAIQSEAQLLQAREQLAFLTGLPAGIALQEAAVDPSGPAALTSYQAEIKNRPDIRAAHKKIAVLRENVAGAQGGRWPSADAGVNYYLDRPSPNQDVKWDAQITLTLSLFSGGVITSKIAEAESQVRQTEQALARVQRLAEQEIRSYYQNFVSGVAQVAALQEAADLAHRNYLAEVREYKNGLVNNLDVLQAMAADQDAQRTLDKGRYAVFIAQASLAAATARISENPGENSK